MRELVMKLRAFWTRARADRLSKEAERSFRRGYPDQGNLLGKEARKLREEGEGSDEAPTGEVFLVPPISDDRHCDRGGVDLPEMKMKETG